MPRTPKSEWAALFNFAGGGLIHLEIFVGSMACPTIFEIIADFLLLRGLHTDRPAASAVPDGTLYAETDTGIVYQTASAAWVTWSASGGSVSAIDTGVGLTGGPITSSGEIALADTAVTPNTYGDATNVPQVTIDAQGRITAAENVPISAGGSGTVTEVDTGTGLTGGPITTTGTIALADTAVTPDTYGDGSNVAQITIDAQGRITAAENVPISGDGGTLDGCRLYTDTFMTIPNSTDTVISWNTEDYDNGGMHSPSTNPERITAIKPGYYAITTNIKWTFNGNGGREVNIRLNGTTIIAQSSVKGGSSTYDTQTLSTLVHLAENDYIEVVLFQDAGSEVYLYNIVDYTPIFAAQLITQ